MIVYELPTPGWRKATARRVATDLTTLVARLERLERLGDRAEDAAEVIGDEIREMPYGSNVTYTVHVALYDGGPAGGVEFDCERLYGHLRPVKARAWHQDWHQFKGYADLDLATTDALWELWGLDAAER